MASSNSLRKDLEHLWCAETSFMPEAWTSKRPSMGQCCVTALLVEEYCGGTIIMGTINGERHYWNEIDGEIVDLTLDQFDEPYIRVKEKERDRKSLLAHQYTKSRYELLRNLLGKWWFV